MKLFHFRLPFLSLSSNSKDVRGLATLPTEILEIIIQDLSASAKGCLALTCKRLYLLMPDAFDGLRLPREQPNNTTYWPVWDKPWVFQAERYFFLRLLEEELESKFFFCRDCFVLHPKSIFEPSTIFNYGNALAMLQLRPPGTPKRKLVSCCREGPLITTIDPEPGGIIDLCPCIKLTPMRKRQIETELRDQPRRNPTTLDSEPENDDITLPRPWHECEHQYDEYKLGIKIYLVLEPDDDVLWARIEYQHTRPVFADWTILRRNYCPHQSIGAIFYELHRCHDEHSDDSACQTFSRVKLCCRCGTRLREFGKLKDNNARAHAHANEVTYTARVERCLSDRNWHRQAFYLPQIPAMWEDLRLWKDSKEWKDFRAKHTS